MTTRAAVRFGLVVFLILACSPLDLLTQSAVPTAEPGGDVPPPTAEPTPREVPLGPETIPPGDYYEVMQEKVEAGEWTTEEGLLAILRALAGQADDPLTGTEMIGREVTGVVLEAQQYVEEGPDAAVRSDLQSLLQVTLPTAERLLPYSQPAPESRGGVPGLGSPALTNPLCVDLYSAGFPSGPAITCYLFQQIPLLGGHFAQVFIPAEWNSTQTEYKIAQATVAAVVDSFNEYNHYGVQQDVLVVFALLDNAQVDTLAARIPTPTDQDQCLIVVYPLGVQTAATDPNGVPGFKQTIAHEMFHCFQMWNYPDHKDYMNQRWWKEGSAEYFSNLVYPTTNGEWDHFPGFVEGSSATSIFNMAYENTLFFQFLEGSIGPQGMIQAFHTLPAGQPITAHIAAVSTWPNISDTWHDFGRAVIGNTMLDTSGEKISLDQAWSGAIQVKQTGVYDLPTQDFTLVRYQLVLGGGQGYHVSVAHTDGEILDATRPSTGGDWGPVTIDRETGCATYYVLPSSSGGTTETRTYQLNGVVDQPAAAGSVCDACVVGRWRMTHASYLTMFNAMMADAGEAAPDVAGTSGDLELGFGNDGLVAAQAMPFSVQTIGSMPDAQGNTVSSEITITFSGGDLMNYLAMDGQLFLETVTPGISMKMLVNLGGQEFEAPITSGDVPIFGGGSPGAPSEYGYICSADHLTLIPLDHPELYKGYVWEFDKVSSTP